MDTRPNVRLAVLFTVGLFAAGCTGGGADGDDGDWELDAGSDGAVDPDGGSADVGERTRSPTTLILENDSEDSIFVQKVLTDCSGNPGWFSVVRSASTLKLWSQCGECRCSESDAGACEAQPCPAACAVGEVEKLGPNEELTFGWDGSYWKRVELENGSCFRETIPPSGAEMAVEFCWGTGSTGTDEPESEITGETCRSVSFSYGGASEVRHRVE